MIRLKHNTHIHLILILGIAMFFVACSRRPKGVMNEKGMVNILTDLHKLDGSLAAKELTYSDFDKKSVYYNSILSKYNITQAEFDSSLVWYSQDSKSFDHIYDKVIANLTDLQKDIKNGKYHLVDTTELLKIKINIWNKRTRYALTKDSSRTHLDFEIPGTDFMLGDTYELKFTQRIAPEDSCKKQLIRFQINYVDGRVLGLIKKVVNDSLTRRYRFRLWATHPAKIKSVKGELLGSSAYKGKLNAITDSIQLTRIFDANKQDSLLKVLQKVDPKHYPTPKIPEVIHSEQPALKNIRRLILLK
jgi:hypothetical protein